MTENMQVCDRPTSNSSDGGSDWLVPRAGPSFTVKRIITACRLDVSFLFIDFVKELALLGARIHMVTASGAPARTQTDIFFKD